MGPQPYGAATWKPGQTKIPTVTLDMFLRRGMYVRDWVMITPAMGREIST
jgi:hypothetical protein